MGAWEKLQLGWLDYKTVPYGTDMTVKLGAADKAAKTSYQALVVPLPERTVTTKHNTPHSGAAEWWSGFGDNLNSTLTRSVDLTGCRPPASVSAYVQGGLEEDYDYLYGEVLDQRWHQLDPGRRADRREPSRGRRRPGTCRPSPVRTSSSASASPPTAASPARPSSTTSPSPSVARPTTDDVEAGAGALDRRAASASSTAPPRGRSRTCTSPRTGLQRLRRTP